MMQPGDGLWDLVHVISFHPSSSGFKGASVLLEIMRWEVSEARPPAEGSSLGPLGASGQEPHVRSVK